MKVGDVVRRRPPSLGVLSYRVWAIDLATLEVLAFICGTEPDGYAGAIRAGMWDAMERFEVVA